MKVIYYLMLSSILMGQQSLCAEQPAPNYECSMRNAEPVAQACIGAGIIGLGAVQSVRLLNCSRFMQRLLLKDYFPLLGAHIESKLIKEGYYCVLGACAVPVGTFIIYRAYKQLKKQADNNQPTSGVVATPQNVKNSYSTLLRRSSLSMLTTAGALAMMTVSGIAAKVAYDVSGPSQPLFKNIAAGSFVLLSAGLLTHAGTLLVRGINQFREGLSNFTV